MRDSIFSLLIFLNMVATMWVICDYGDRVEFSMVALVIIAMSLSIFYLNAFLRGLVTPEDEE
jgi:hypothetical protein